MNITPAFEPKKYPLNIILIGTTILAIPAVYGTFVLFSETSPIDMLGNLLLCVSITGFVLFAGYILTAIYKKHTVVLWLSSMLYNLGLSLGYLYFIFAAYFNNRMPFLLSIYQSLTSGVMLLPLWTILVTVASAYYLKHTLRQNKTKLP